MIYRENPNFVARATQPNPREVSYWIDLTESPQGQIIKTWVSGKWVKINPSDASGEGLDLSEVQAAVANLTANKADKSEVYTREETVDLITASIDNVVDAAPGALDTLNELAAALNDDPNFATTITNTIAQKQDKLISGESIKTINGNSLLGEGNIVIQGGEGGDIDLSDYALKTEIPDVSEFITETEADGKYQATLVSNSNIKTINGQSVLGSGNIEITTGTGGVTDAPADGNIYGRKDNTWESITIPDTSNLATKEELASKANTSDLSNYLTTANASTTYETISGAQSKYQPVGEYALKSEMPSLSGYATESYVNAQVSNLVNSAPEALDTLKELADALDNDANFAATVTNQIATKLDASTYTADKATFALKTDIPTVPTKLSQLENDSSFATTTQLETKLDTATYNSEKANFATKSEVNAKVSGTGITGIQVVSELPGSPTQNVLYIVTAS